MNRLVLHAWVAAAVGLVWSAFAVPLQACSVPVFRYALELERWPVDPYEVFVFHKGGDLAPAHRQALERLKAASVAERPDGVIDLWLIDLAKGSPEGEAAKVWQAHAESARLPWMVVRYPRVFGIPIDVWAGPLEPEAAERLLDSPARRQVARWLLEGETAVFVVLESGDAEADEAVAARLRKHLDRMEKLLEPPEPPGGVWGDPVYDTEGAPELTIGFQVLRLSRSDPAEAFLRAALLGCEPGLGKEAGPIVFPVFGRGRVLCALVGEGISPENIEDVCAFLTGPCSCVIKYQNPGVDMLMDVQWDAALMGEPSAIPEVVPPPLTGLAKFAAAAEKGAGAAASAPASEEPESSAPAADEAGAVGFLAAHPALGAVAAAVLGLAGVALVSALVWRRSRRTEA